MIPLEKTTVKLQVVLAGAVTTNQLQCMIVFYDVPGQTKTEVSEYRRSTKRIATNSTTDVDICDANQIVGTVRMVEEINIYNNDTVAATAIVKIDDGGSETILVRQALLSTETLHYKDTVGWQII